MDCRRILGPTLVSGGADAPRPAPGSLVDHQPGARGVRHAASRARPRRHVGGGGMSAALINAIARDVPLKLIADKGSLRQGFGYESLVVRKDLFDSGVVTTIPDLKGRKIALNSTTSMDFFLLDGTLESAGV